jgi:hypothetical protein
LSVDEKSRHWKINKPPLAPCLRTSGVQSRLLRRFLSFRPIPAPDQRTCRRQPTLIAPRAKEIQKSKRNFSFTRIRIQSCAPASDGKICVSHPIPWRRGVEICRHIVASSKLKVSTAGPIADDQKVKLIRPATRGRPCQHP